MGDSYVKYNGINDLEPRLESLARADGALGATQSYRNYAQAGFSLASGGFGLIPPQVDMAIRANPDIKFVVFSGGGNDVLLGDQTCLIDGSSMRSSCTMVATKAIQAAKGMLDKLKAAGVAEIVQFFYPHAPAGGAELSDWAIPMYKQQCESASTEGFRCHFVDSRALFEGKTGMFQSDGIHPSSKGADMLAELLYTTMKDNCIAQPASSGCCTP